MKSYRKKTPMTNRGPIHGREPTAYTRKELRELKKIAEKNGEIVFIKKESRKTQIILPNPNYKITY